MKTAILFLAIVLSANAADEIRLRVIKQTDNTLYFVWPVYPHSKSQLVLSGVNGPQASLWSEWNATDERKEVVHAIKLSALPESQEAKVFFVKQTPLVITATNR